MNNLNYDDNIIGYYYILNTVQFITCTFEFFVVVDDDDDDDADDMIVTI